MPRRLVDDPRVGASEGRERCLPRRFADQCRQVVREALLDRSGRQRLIEQGRRLRAISRRGLSVSLSLGSRLLVELRDLRGVALAGALGGDVDRVRRTARRAAAPLPPAGAAVLGEVEDRARVTRHRDPSRGSDGCPDLRRRGSGHTCGAPRRQISGEMKGSGRGSTKMRLPRKSLA